MEKDIGLERTLVLDDNGINSEIVETINSYCPVENCPGKNNDPNACIEDCRLLGRTMYVYLDKMRKNSLEDAEMLKELKVLYRKN